jgi:hypothetical protein
VRKTRRSVGPEKKRALAATMRRRVVGPMEEEKGRNPSHEGEETGGGPRQTWRGNGGWTSPDLEGQGRELQRRFLLFYEADEGRGASGQCSAIWREFAPNWGKAPAGSMNVARYSCLFPFPIPLSIQMVAFEVTNSNSQFLGSILTSKRIPREFGLWHTLNMRFCATHIVNLDLDYNTM